MVPCCRKVGGRDDHLPRTTHGFPEAEPAGPVGALASDHLRKAGNGVTHFRFMFRETPSLIDEGHRIAKTEENYF